MVERIQFDKPKILAGTFITGLWLVCMLCLLLFDFITPTTVQWLYVLPLSIVLGFIAFYLLYLALERFIYSKVKIIYKNIHDLKIGKDQKELNATRSTDLSTVGKEVAQWAKQQTDEIQNLRESEIFRREFIGSVSHELRTPVFNIQGYLLTLLDGALDDPEINRKFLSRANKSVDRMINIIDDLAKISNLESNRVQITPSKFNLQVLVKEVFDLLKQKAEKNEAKLVLKKEHDKPVMVLADRSKIEQVLINLITNAIKYGKDKGTIEVRFFDMHDQVLTEIVDNGPGIPKEDLPRVFERFYRVDKSRSRDAGGTGLGLAIVKHLIEAHKETINVRSKLGEGSIFSFTLKKAK